MDSSPTLVVKSVKRINSAFFPWSSRVIVPACCFSYEVVKEEKKEGYEEHVKEVDDESDINCKNHSTTTTTGSEIKVLKPYTDLATRSLSPETFCNDPKCCKIEKDLDMIPSPLGSRKSANIDATFDHHLSCHSTAELHQTYYKTNTMQYTQQRAFEAIQEPRKHRCEYCFKSFKRSSSLSNHRMIHKNDKTFKCNQCNMCFLRKSDLGKHMVIHSGSKPYQCNVCGKRFSQSSNMLTHQRRHTGIRPYSCTICGKSFYRKVDVRRHASVHRADYK